MRIGGLRLSIVRICTGRRVRAHDVPAVLLVRRQVNVERVLNVARGMVGGRVQRVEAMPLVLDLRPVLDGKSHAAKDGDGALEDLRERMQVADGVAATR